MWQMLWKLLLVTLINGSASQRCSRFFPELQLPVVEFSFQSYRNWASSIDITVKFLVFYPRSGRQVVSVVSWAYSAGRNVRVEGYRHSYPPLTVSERDDPCVIIIDMTRYLKQVKMWLSLPNSNVEVVVAEPGVTMEELLTFAERNGYGMEHYPVIGRDATLGGVLAIGGHGAGIPSINEKFTSRGFFGSVSNLIGEIKAVVWEPRVSNANRGEYPIDRIIQFRVTGLDEPLERFIPGAVLADISPTSPIPARPDFDVGVWMNTCFTTNQAFSSSFMKEFEEWAYTRFNGSDSVIRPEWSKTWAYTDAGPFTNQKLLHHTIPLAFGVDRWNHAVQVLHKYDPNSVISNRFLRGLLTPYISSTDK